MLLSMPGAYVVSMHLQATFEIKISAPPPPVVVLSNMPLSHTHGGRKLHDGEQHEHTDNSKPASTHRDELVIYHFLASPPMSTYLVAWVVGELAHVEMKCPLTLPAPESPWSLHLGEQTVPGCFLLSSSACPTNCLACRRHPRQYLTASWNFHQRPF